MIVLRRYGGCCLASAGSVLGSSLQRQNPVDEILCLLEVLRLDFLVFFLVAVVELHHLAAGDVLEQLFLRVIVASVLGRDVSQGRTILFLFDRVALVTAAVTGKTLGGADVDPRRIQAEQEAGRRQRESSDPTKAASLRNPLTASRRRGRILARDGCALRQQRP